MRIGIPKEVKKDEYRVGATPATVRAFVDAGHPVQVQKDAGAKIGFSDTLYQKAGATIVSSASEVYKNELIIKVKEVQAAEFPLLHEGQILFCYLHLAPDPEQTKHLLDRKVIGIAYDTVSDEQHRLPLLAPMSSIAGRLAIQVGATALQLVNGGRGVILGGIAGVAPAKVVILGAGIAGTESMRAALGLGADVSIFDRNLNRLKEIDQLFGPAVKTLYSTQAAIEESVLHADLLVGTVLVPGKKAPKLVSKELVQKMIPGSVIVDIAIDQGGCIETSRPTTHSDPTYLLHDVVHYAVTNMPAACARTSTQALTNATLPYALLLANLGYKKALLQDPGFLLGLNVYRGKVTNKAVAEDLNYTYVAPDKALE